jgi:lysophospholipase L1-like esterase
MVKNNILLMLFVFILFGSMASAYPLISFVNPTPQNASNVIGNSFEINVSTTTNGRSYTFINLDNSIVAWYRFNNETGENATFVRDWTGKYNLTAFSTAPTYNANSIFGSGHNFSNTNGNNWKFINMPQINNTEKTFSMWVKPFSANEADNLISFQLDLVMVLRDTTSPTTISYYDGTGWRPSAVTADLNQWNHIVFVFNNSGGRIYKNGVNITGYLTYAYKNISSGVGVIGGTYQGTNPLNGSLDDIVIFNRSLTDYEVLALYNSSQYQYYRNFTNIPTSNHTVIAYSVNESGFTNFTDFRSFNVLNKFVSVGSLGIYPSNATKDNLFYASCNISTNATYISGLTTGFLYKKNTSDTWIPSTSYFLPNRTVFTIGDSLLNYGGNIQTTLDSLLGSNSATNNFAVGGTTLPQILVSLNETIKNNTYLLVDGGQNDLGFGNPNSSIPTNIISLINNVTIKAISKNMSITWVSLFPPNTTYVNTTTYTVVRNYLLGQYKINYPNVTVIDSDALFNNGTVGYWNLSYTADTVHPSVLGQQTLGRAIFNQTFKGTRFNYYYTSINLSSETYASDSERYYDVICNGTVEGVSDTITSNKLFYVNMADGESYPAPAEPQDSSSVFKNAILKLIIGFITLLVLGMAVAGLFTFNLVDLKNLDVFEILKFGVVILLAIVLGGVLIDVIYSNIN